MRQICDFFAKNYVKKCAIIVLWKFHKSSNLYFMLRAGNRPILLQRKGWDTDGLTLKQKKFADEYIISGNATEAYKKAYPNVKSDKAAMAGASRLLRNVKVKTYIENRLAEINSKKIADQTEILMYWTSIMRGKAESEEVISLQDKGTSYVKTIIRKPNQNERITASKELAKRIIDVQSTESKEDKLDKLLNEIQEVIQDE